MSSSSSVSSSILDGYLKGPGRFFDKGRVWAEHTDRFLMLGEHLSGIGKNISVLTGNTEATERCASISSTFGAARSPLSFGRTFVTLEKAFTGKMFWRQTESGTWLKATTTPQGEYKTNNRGEIEHDAQGTYVTRDWMDIAMDLLALAARTLSGILFGHNHNLYNLGQHAKWIKGAVIGLWGAVLSINLVQSIRNLVDETNKIEIRKKVMEVIKGIFDLLALPFDCGIGMNVHPGLAIAGGIFSTLSAGTYLISEVIC